MSDAERIKEILYETRYMVREKQAQRIADYFASRLTPPEPSVEEVFELAKVKWPNAHYITVSQNPTTWDGTGISFGQVMVSAFSTTVAVEIAPTLAQLAAKLKEPPHEST